jgi:hypothetical protein
VQEPVGQKSTTTGKLISTLHSAIIVYLNDAAEPLIRAGSSVDLIMSYARPAIGRLGNQLNGIP